MPAALQASFAKGEISSSLYGRVDTAAYQVALRTARNVVIHTHGGVSNRPGTVFLGPVKDHTASPRLIDFQFKTSDTYVLEFGNLYMRVIRDDAHVLETGVVVSGATQADPVVITATAHGFSDGDEVYISGVVGMTEINGKRFDVASKTANTFELTDQVTGANIDGTGFTAYSSAGTVARVFTLTTPYITADLRELKYVQSADVMTLTHPTYEARELTRTDHDAWTLDVITFEPAQAFPTGQTVTVDGTPASETQKYRVTAIAEGTFEESLPALNNTTVSAGSATAANPVVVTATGHGFLDGDEVYISGFNEMTEVNGRRFKVAGKTTNTFQLEGEDGTGYAAETTGGSANLTFVRVTNGLDPIDNTISWTAIAGAQRYAVYREDNGLYGLIGETEDVTFKDADISPDLSASPPAARNPFRLAGDFPGTVSYYEQRRVFGGSTNNPDTKHYTQTGNQSNMSVSTPSQSDDAITATLASLQVNEIRHFVPGNDLIVFTSGSEWRINSGSDAGFEASSLRQKPQTYWGSSHIRPITIGGTTLFVQENKSAVRSIGFSLQIDGYTGSDITILADHLFETYQLEEWAFTRSPDVSIKMVRSDGHAVSLTFNREQEVIAWSTWDTLGKFESVASIKPSSAEIDDAAYFVVKRMVNGNTVRYIERTHSRRFNEVQDCFFVDCGLSLDNPVTITGATSADPVVITATAHGFSDGDEVDINGIKWVSSFDATFNETQPDQLNRRRFKVANKTANTFELTNIAGVDIDGSAFDAYTEGGEVREAVLSVSGLDHLEGEEVVILADGNVISSKTISGGSVTLDRKASRIHVGLRFIADIELLNIEAPSGTIQGKPKKIPEVTIRFKKSRGLFIGPNSSKLTEMKQREFEDYGDPTALLTGDKRIPLPPSWNVDGRLFMRQPYPLPTTILAVIPDIDIGERGDE